MRLHRSISLPLAAAALALAALSAGAPRGVHSASVPWDAKVDRWVITTAGAGPTEFLVHLAVQADVSAAHALQAREDKGRYVTDTLRATAARTQGPLLALLAGRGIEHRAYWVANMIWVRGDLALVEELAQRDDVGHVYANPWVRMHDPVERGVAAMAPEAIEWGVARVRAPEVWAQGFTGQGVVIGGQDTGYDWDHPALINKYRGWNGVTADHNYNWHDAIHSGGGVCGPNSPEPCDDNNHGTHTMGTMVGDDGGANQIGVAPGAKWMACRNMDQGNGTPATYSECFQWFIAPTDLNNQNPDPTRAPHVINNSWACPPSEGCNPDSLQAVVENTRAAGIVVVVSAGNSGSACSTVRDPPAIYGASFSVGSTTIGAGDPISSFSSRGPVTIDGSNRLKPNVSAPGSSVRSSVRNGGYSTFSGTSMAAPHVAGVVGLFLSRHPALKGQVSIIERTLQGTAAPRTTTQTCGGVPGTAIPNNTYGWGRVDALDAVTLEADLGLAATAWPATSLAGASFSYTMTVDNAGPLDATAVTLSQPLPAGFAVDATTPSQGTCNFAGGVLTCSLGSLAVGASATVGVTVTPSVAGPASSTATVSAAETDILTANNSVGLQTTVQSCPLAAPVVTAPLDAPPGTPGLQASVAATQPGHTYTWTVAGGAITGGQGTGTVTFTAGSAGTTMIVSVVDSVAGCDSPPGRRNVQVHFLDVPPGHSFHNFVNTLARNQVTGGCGSGNYCPDVSIPREQMAVFLLVAKEGAGYLPPACVTPMFADVPCSNPFARWVNELATRGITGGCGGANFCPQAAVSREQMAVFLLLAKEGAGYNPPACVTPTFGDVPCSSPFARWIEELALRAITGGCGNGNYCPASPNTRGQMAVFIVTTFGLN